MAKVFNELKSVSFSRKKIGKQLARIRRSRGFTQKELADRLDITQSMISDYENGGIRLHAEQILRLSYILGVTTDELLGATTHRSDLNTDRNQTNE